MKSKNKKEKINHRYIFPDFLARAMSKVSQRVQFEASMMSMTLMSIGMILTIIYMFFYTDFRLWFRITLVLNGVFGLIFMWSYIVTTFNAYKAYMEAVEFQEEMKKNGRTNKV